ncbi:MAG TPA: PilZ domain-containing protein [Dissulfurispiraceae bacterium]|nr:PilZ domain-containing protein [Dissulfurispiraceae bacterium]
MDTGLLGLFIRNTEKDAEKRCRPRIKCAVVTELTDTRGSAWSCKIVDFSENGLCVATGASLTTGSLVSISRPAIEAKVVWSADNKAGLRIIR